MTEKTGKKVRSILSKPHTAYELADKMAVSKMTAYKYLRQLDEEGGLTAHSQVRQGAKGPLATKYVCK